MDISIHALLAESDLFFYILQRLNSYFYPRSPCGERHCNFSQKRHPLTISIHALLAESDYTDSETCPSVFISIHALLAESDPRGGSCYLDNIDFYPRSPCGERPLLPTDDLFFYGISIHALLAESDLTMCVFCSMIYTFLSTLSLRRATAL